MSILLQYFGIVSDIFVITSILYVLFVLTRKEAKNESMKEFEGHRKALIFRDSLLLLSASIFLGLVLNNHTTFQITQEISRNALFLLSKLFQLGFGLMIIRTTKYTNLAEREIGKEQN